MKSAFATLFAESATRPLLAKFAIAVFAVGALIHGQAVGFGFVKWDDPPLVYNNPEIRSLAPGNVLAMFTPEPGKTYQPVRVLSYAIDHAIFGLKPGAFHFTNVLLHCLASALLLPLVFAMLCELRNGRERENRVVALIAALLFAVHPVNVESVSWVASRKYGLLAVFSFLSLWCYLRSSQTAKPDWRFLSASVVFALLATMSSPFGVTLPALIVFFDFCRGRLRSNLLFYAPFAACFAIMYGVIAYALGSESGPGVGPSHIEGKFHWTAFTMLRVIFDYGTNLTVPLWLNHKYPNHFEESIIHWKILLVLALLIATVIFLVKDYRSGHRCPLFCLGWMLIAWAPVSNVVPISHTMADRYMYLPSVGFCIFLGLVANLLARRRLALGLGFSGVVLVVFAIIAFLRVGVWKDDRTLWEASLKTDPNNPTALFNIGVYEHNEGKLEAAEQKYRRSLALFEMNSGVHHNLGTLLAGRKDYAEALVHFRRAIDLQPGRVETYNNLGGVLSAMGQLDAAADSFAKSSELTGRPDGYVQAGLCYGGKQMHAQALGQFEKALALDTNNAEALKGAAVSLANLKDFPAAEAYFARYVAIVPQDTGAAKMLAQVRRAIAAQQATPPPVPND